MLYQLSRDISQHYIHLICIQETHTIQIQQLSQFSHCHKFLAYPNTDQSLSPQITHRQGTLTLINTQLLKLSPQMITTHTILLNYIQSLFFTLYNMNYTLINCYFSSGKTSTQTSQRIKAIQKLISYLQNLNYKNRQLIIARDFNLVLNRIDRTGHFSPSKNDKIFFQKLLSNFDLIDSYRYLYPNTKTFSFSRSQSISRLDRIYVPSSLTIKITQTSYHNITFSDHNKAPIIFLKLLSKTTFKSFHWKLNDFILSFPKFYQYIEAYIKTFYTPLTPFNTLYIGGTY